MLLIQTLLCSAAAQAQVAVRGETVYTMAGEAIKDGVVDANDETIETLHSQTIHLANLVEDLRIVAITDAGALALNKSFDSPVPVIEDAALNFVQRARERGVELTVSRTGIDPVIEFDETRLRQIVTNLVENALTHTPNNGSVTVEISGSTDGLKIVISDSGAGIASGDLPHIFDQFYRADPSRNRATGGAGLGLTIVKKLVEAHGGTVAVTSSLGDGSTFTVLLPATHA